MTEGARNGQNGTSDGLTPHTTTDAGDDVSEDIRAKAQKVWDECEARSITDTTLAQFASHVLATEARLDVAPRGALQSREEMREWLGSDEAGGVVAAALVNMHAVPERTAIHYADCALHALAAAMPGGDA